MQAITCTDFVRVQVYFNRIRFRLCLRVVPTHISIIFGMPFFTRFNRIIDWRRRSVQIFYSNRFHAIPILPTATPQATANSISYPHDPLPATPDVTAEPYQWVRGYLSRILQTPMRLKSLSNVILNSTSMVTLTWITPRTSYHRRIQILNWQI